jgi:WD40 repeat protein
MTISDNGEVFAAFHGENVCTFEAETAQKAADTGYCGDPGRYGVLSLSPNGKWLATSRRDEGRVKVWDSFTGSLIKEPPDPELAQSRGIKPVFAPDGRSLVITCDTSCRIWQTNSWAPGARFARSDLAVMAVSHRSGMIALRESQTSILLRDLGSGGTLATLPSPGLVQDLAFSPDDTQLAVTHSGSHELLVWDLRLVRQQVAKMGLDWAKPPFPPADKPPRTTSIRVIAEGPPLSPGPVASPGPIRNP